MADTDKETDGPSEAGLLLMKRLGTVVGLNDPAKTPEGEYYLSYTTRDIAAAAMFLRMATEELPCSLTITLDDGDKEYEYEAPDNVMVVLESTPCNVMVKFSGPMGEAGVGAPPDQAKDFMYAFMLGWNHIDDIGDEELANARRMLRDDFAKAAMRGLAKAILNKRGS